MPTSYRYYKLALIFLNAYKRVKSRLSSHLKTRVSQTVNALYKQCAIRINVINYEIIVLVEQSYLLNNKGTDPRLVSTACV